MHLRPPDLLYLSRAEIEGLAIPFRDIAAVVEEAFRDLAAGRAENVPKSGFHPTAARFFHAMPALLSSAGGVAGVKWVGVGDNAALGQPHLSALILLSDLATSMPVAVLDGDWITGLRPASVSLAAARRLARPDSARIGFVACGQQARAHLAALRGAFPLRDLRCYSRNPATAEAFAAAARETGLSARAVPSAAEAVAERDIVVTSVPRSPGLERDLDPGALAPGCFVTATDLARTWRGERIGAFDLVVTDDIPQSAAQAEAGAIPWRGRLDLALADLVTGRHPGRRGAAERIMFVHPGMALGDIAIAALVLARARAAGIGTRLAR